MSYNDTSPLQMHLTQYADQGRTALLPALHSTQALLGYIPEQAAEVVGHILGVPLADVHGVIEFYSLFYSEPVGNTILQVCTDPPCAMRGGEELLQSLCRHLGTKAGEITPDGSFTVERAACLGLCSHAPALLEGSPSRMEIAIGNADPDQPASVIAHRGQPPRTAVYGSHRILTANCGQQTTSLKKYEAGGGYHALRKTLKMIPEEVIAEVRASGLVGRGGAAFPTSVKWEGVSQAPGDQKYVVCNADESEPGTFKDRILMEDDPHRILEGMIIAAYAIGASTGYIYVRGEYPNAFRALAHAIEEAHQAGYLGPGILGAQFGFDIELRLGAGAYICGEETALFESIEGKRGFPRLKPPFPTTNGLYGLPTAINNVETLCNVPFIIEQGAQEFRRLGTEKSTGTKLFCLSGDVARPGLYEVPFGVSLRYLLYDLAGGLSEGSQLQAVLFGGAAGSFATPNNLDVEMSFEGLRLAGLPLGSGVVLVIDQKRDLRQILLGLAHFFAHESCGKCFPCQIGTQRQYEILQRVASGETLPGDFERLSDVGWTMSDASICGLGQTAASAVLSAMQLWPGLFHPA